MNVVDVVKRDFVVGVVPCFPIGALSAVVAVSAVREAGIPLGQMALGHKPVDSHRCVGNDIVEQRGCPKNEREGEKLHERLCRRLPKLAEGSKAGCDRTVRLAPFVQWVRLRYNQISPALHTMACG